MMALRAVVAAAPAERTDDDRRPACVCDSF
jgi:hypothetical protein